MKKYLFGLGAMVVGAGLMFALMHGEVSAGSKPEIPEPFVCSGYTQLPYGDFMFHCETKTLECAAYSRSLSCFRKGMFK